MSSQEIVDFYTADNLKVMDALSGHRSLIPGTIVSAYNGDTCQYFEIVSRTAKFAIVRKVTFIRHHGYEPTGRASQRRVRIRNFENKEWFSGDRREMVFGSNLVEPFQTYEEYIATQRFVIGCPDCRDLHQSQGHANSKAERAARGKSHRGA